MNPKDAKFCQACGTRMMLGDRYQAFQSLGQGTSTRTFLAMDKRKLVDARCIIKALEMDEDGEAFRQKVVQLDRVFQHPQVATVYAYFERSGYHYLVQEFVEGRTLLKILQEFGAFDEAKIWHVCLDFLPVLKCLHDNWIIHRDIKPQNLIRRGHDGQEGGSLVLVDVGTAKHTTRSQLAKTGTVIGSAEYVAPEQLIGKAIFASDLYSLGVTCLHLITGLSPFDLFNHVSHSWLWRSVSGPVSDELATILDRLVAKDPNERYQDVNQVWTDVKAGWDAVRDRFAETNWVANPVSLPSIPKLQTSDPSLVAEAWQCVTTLEIGDPVNAIALGQSGKTVISGGNDRMIRCWDLETGNCVQTLEGHRQAIAALAVSPDGKILASGGWEPGIRLWDLTTGTQIQTLSGHTNRITAIAFVTFDKSLPSGGLQLVTASRDGTIKLWQQDTPEAEFVDTFTFQGHQASVESLALSPIAPLMVSGDSDGSVKIWHLEFRELLRSLAKHRGSVSAIAIAPLEPLQTPINPDRLMVISGSWDMSIRLRNLNTGGVYRSLTGHLLPVGAIGLSPNQRLIATGSHDTTIKLWNLASGDLITTLSGHLAAVTSVAFNTNATDQDQVISSSQDGTIKSWQSVISGQ